MTLALLLAAAQIAPATDVFLLQRNVGDVRFADFDQDGSLDAALPIVSDDRRIQLRMGVDRAVPLDGPLLRVPQNLFDWQGLEVEALDVEGDGDTDLVAFVTRELFFSEDQVGVYVWTNDGTGSFSAPTLVYNAGVPSPGIAAFCAGELDGDIGAEACVSIGLNVMAIQLDTGASAFLLSAPARALQLELADLDQDGDADLAFASGLTVGWGANDGTGSIGAVTTSALTTAPAFEEQASLGAFDQNGDGFVDLVFGRSEGFPLNPLNPNSPITFSTSIFRMEGSPTGPTATLTTLAGPLTGAGFTAVDVDGNGLLDLVRSEDGSVTVRRTGAQGVILAPEVLLDASTDFSFVRGSVDLDADGSFEVVADVNGGQLGGQLMALEVAPAGTVPLIAESTLLRASIGADSDPALVDLNGDGRLDLVASSRTRPVLVGLLGSVEGPLTEHASLWGLRTGQSVQAEGPANVVADIDGDGNIDVLLQPGGVSDTLFAVVAGSGPGGAFAREALIQVPGADLTRVHLADMDGDGDLDIGLLDVQNRRFYVYRFDGPGIYTMASELETDHDLRESAMADLDGDGDLDLLLDGKLNPPFTTGPRRLREHMNDGQGTFGPGSTVATLAALASNELGFALFPGDFNGDGVVDVLRVGRQRFALDSYGVDIFLRGPAGGPTMPTPLFETQDSDEPLPRVVIDFDGDGALDFLAHGERSNVIYLYRGLGDGSFAGPIRVGGDSPFGTIRIVAGDVDGDGDPDVVSVDQSSSRTVWYESPVLGDLGTSFCGAVPNSTGTVGTLTASGSARVDDANLILTAADLPPMQFGLMVTGTAPASVLIPNSVGRLCVGGDLGRFTQPGEVQSSGPGGLIELTVDLGMLPGGAAFTTAAAGETRFFQLWHRDVGAAGPSSNLTEALFLTVF